MPSAAPGAPAATPPLPATPAVAAGASHFKWQLEVEPRTMSMAQRSSCRIRITVTNEGTKSGSPDLYLADWTLNGKSSRGLNMAFQNGASTKRLHDLPPKETVSAERAACRLMERPGHYTVGFQHGTVRLTAAVDVTP